MEKALMTPQPYRRCSLPPLLRLAERFGTALRSCGVPLARLTEDSVLRAARRATGVREFADESFREPLRIVLREHDRNPNVNLVGKLIVRDFCLSAVINRLRIQRLLETYPEIREIPIRRPLFITGLPRTGTTLLYSLLAQDPGARAPRFWELLTPAPDPDWLRAGRDPRRQTAEKRLRTIHRFSPESRAVHNIEVDAPEECEFLFHNCFAAEICVAFAEAPEYWEWLQAQAMIEEYRYYRLQLQVLLWQGKGDHLVLKWPMHAFHLRALWTVFPDADVLFTHRDPASCVGSACSGMLGIRRISNRRVDVRGLGAWCLDFLGTIGDRAASARREEPPGRSYDVPYNDLVRDPLDMVRRIYRHFDRPLAPETERGAEEWLRAHPQNLFGKHRYDLEEYGLSPEAVRERFADYSALGTELAVN
jgi:hypothetical protein